MNELIDRTIRLSWSTEEIFGEACTLSGYEVRNATDGQGASAFDALALTEDERPFFRAHLGKAFDGLLLLLRRQIPDRVLSECTERECAIRFRARLDGEGMPLFSREDLRMADEAGRRLIVSALLQEWYMAAGAEKLSGMYGQKVVAETAGLSRLLFRFYRPPVRPAFRVSGRPGRVPGPDCEFWLDGGIVKQCEEWEQE